MDSLFFVSIGCLIMFAALFAYFVVPSERYFETLVTIFALYFVLGFIGLMRAQANEMRDRMARRF